MGKELRSLGWYDYIKIDIPESFTAVSLAADVLLYLSVSPSGWNRHRGVLAGLLAFLESQSRILPTERQLLELATLLSSRPVNTDAVRKWFDRIYSVPLARP